MPDPTPNPGAVQLDGADGPQLADTIQEEFAAELAAELAALDCDRDPADYPGGNPYWAAVQAWAARSPAGRMVLGDRYTGLTLQQQQRDWFTVAMPFIAMQLIREELTRKFVWTITAPDTVEFVLEHCGRAVIDPLAGNGYWPHMLTLGGVDVHASDLAPPRRQYVTVNSGDCVDAIRGHGAGRTLLLSWPPLGFSAGHDAVAAYMQAGGERIVYIGEVGGMCGDDALLDLLRTHWRPTAHHTPAQWWGIHDEVLVLEPERGQPR